METVLMGHIFALYVEEVYRDNGEENGTDYSGVI